MSDDQAVLPFEGNGHLIRRQWVDDRWFFSVVDVVAVLSESPNPRNYWSMLKRKLADEGYDELYRNCVQLKMRSLDGKRYATDAADTETLLRIIQSIPSPKAEPFKLRGIYASRRGTYRRDCPERSTGWSHARAESDLPTRADGGSEHFTR